MTALPFSCACGKIKGQVDRVARGGLHLVCHCDSCRAGALHCGADLGPDAPVDLYLTPPHHVTVTAGQENLEPFAFSPRGILRWKSRCCGVQMFSSQPNPKTAFMSVRADRFADPKRLGPVRTTSFIPGMKGGKMHKGKRALAGLVFKAAAARISGRWRQTPLYNPATRKPIAQVTLISKEAKKALLGA